MQVSPAACYRLLLAAQSFCKSSSLSLLSTLNARLPNDVHSSPRASESNSFSCKTITLAVAALGVVFGDIGTSPLYTLRECFRSEHAIPLTETNVYGVMSLIFWSLTQFGLKGRGEESRGGER